MRTMIARRSERKIDAGERSYRIDELIRNLAVRKIDGASRWRAHLDRDIRFGDKEDREIGPLSLGYDGRGYN